MFLARLLRPPRPGTVRSARGYLAWTVVGKVTNLRRAAERRAVRERSGASLARADGLTEDELETLRVEVSKLAQDLRLAVELRYFGGLRNREIAETLDSSERDVERKLQTARRILRERLIHLAPSLLVLDPVHAGPPTALSSTLLSSLLRISSHGSALAPPSVLSLGGLAVLKKTVAAGVAVLLLLAGLAFWTRSQEGGPRQDPSVLLSERDLPDDSPPASAATGDEQSTDARVAASASPPLRTRVYGRIEDDDGNPVPDARVVLRRELEDEEAQALREEGYADIEPGVVELETTAGPDAAYAFPDLVPATYQVYMFKAPFCACYPSKVSLEAGDDKAVNPRLCLSYELEGRVVDSTGNPIAGAEVLIAPDVVRCDLDRERDDLWPVYPTDDAGRYRSGPGLVLSKSWLTDPFDVWARAPGYGHRSARIASEQFRDRKGVLDFVLEPEYRVMVKVIDQNERPLAGAQVSTSSSSFPKYAERTDPEGNVVLDALTNGEHSFYVERDGYYRERVTAPSPRELEHEMEVRLRRLNPPVRGRIVFDERIPEAARPSGIDEIFLDRLNAAGERKGLIRARFPRKDNPLWEYSVRPEVPGTYQLVCRIGLVTYKNDPFYYDAIHEVNQDILIELTPPYLSGTAVRAGSGEPLAETPVVALCAWSSWHPWASCEIVNGFRFPRAPGNRIHVRTDRDGQFLVNLPTYAAVQGSQGFSVTLLIGSKEIGWSLHEPLDCGDDSVIEGLRVEVHPSGSIFGRVVDGAERPVRNEVVVAYDGKSFIEQATTANDGTYRIDGLRPGNYLVVPLGRQDAPNGHGGGPGDDHALPPPAEFFEFPVRLEPGKDVEVDLDLSKDALGAIEGIVPEGTEASSVAWASVIDHEEKRTACLGGELDLKTDSFWLPRLLPGTYRVWLEDAGERVASTTVEVERARVTTVRFAPAAGE